MSRLQQNLAVSSQIIALEYINFLFPHDDDYKTHVLFSNIFYNEIPIFFNVSNSTQLITLSMHQKRLLFSKICCAILCKIHNKEIIQFKE